MQKVELKALTSFTVDIPKSIVIIIVKKALTNKCKRYHQNKSRKYAKELSL